MGTAPAFQQVPLPGPLPPVLAAGPFLKNTLCAIDGASAWISGINGNLDDPAAIGLFEAAAADLLARPGWTPLLIAHDLHPDFHSTRWALHQTAPALAVQHHHAHIAAVAAEHGWTAPLIGIALDGFGLGPGNEAWGGERLLVDGPVFRRTGHLALMAQPGGDIAARQPWRMAAAALHRMGRGDSIAARFPDRVHAGPLARMIAGGINCPMTSSAGRLFDAACGLLNVHPVADFEGQAPIALEALVSRPAAMTGGWRLDGGGVLDFLPVLEALADLGAPAKGADLFHGTLIAGLLDWADEAARDSGVTAVALSGGCFFNKVLRQGMVDGLMKRGLTPLLPARVSPGDPGVSLGQAWVAALAAGRMA